VALNKQDFVPNLPFVQVINLRHRRNRRNLPIDFIYKASKDEKCIQINHQEAMKGTLLLCDLYTYKEQKQQQAKDPEDKIDKNQQTDELIFDVSSSFSSS